MSKIHNNEKIQMWLDAPIPPHLKERILHLQKTNPVLLNEGFEGNISFGTGGLRALMDVGTARMNEITITAVTHALAHYLTTHHPSPSVAIAFDSRNNSEHFALIAAATLSTHKIQTLIFPQPTPTPLLSFAIRHLQCNGGIVITASHNPKEYNGYKVYGKDGAQLTSPADTFISKKLDEILTKVITPPQAINTYIQNIDNEVIQAYMHNVEKLLSPNDSNTTYRKNISITYTPLHGTGGTIIPPLLTQLGFTHLHSVATQAKPDGNFPTLKSPNPEDHNALILAVTQAKNQNADLILATDPDADRIAIGIKNPTTQNNYILLNGNQSAALLFHFILKKYKNTPNTYTIKSIVTSELLTRISEDHGIPCYNTLTGFKWIAQRIAQTETTEKFLIGAEESLGILIGDNVRDKDGCSSAAATAEMIAQYKNKGIPPLQILENIYQQYGFFYEEGIAITIPGTAGVIEMNRMMHTLRHNPPTKINHTPILQTKDYVSQICKNVRHNTESKIALPPSNVLQYLLEDQTLISVRPSGTEPKIKFYFSIYENNYTQFGNYNEAVTLAKEKIQAYYNAIKKITHNK